MLGKEFTKQAKKIGGQVKKIDSAYWGKVWWEAVFEDKVVSFQITFEENQKVGVRVLGKNDVFVTAEDLAQSAILQTKIALFVHEINQ